MDGGTELIDFEADSGQNVMITAYYHDDHTLNGKPHRTGSDTFAGVPVNPSYGPEVDATNETDGSLLRL